MNTYSFTNAKITDFTDEVDVCDGLTPSLRALFYALNETNQDGKFKNSSRLLRKVIGLDEDVFESVYDILVNTTYPRVDLPFINGHGGFGFPPAHPDFSEIKLTDFGKAMVERSVSDKFELPFTIPIPYVLANGSPGYCKSKTKIPTHNLCEIIDAMIALVKNPGLKTKDLLQIIKGPDLLIGGAIENPEELCSIYENGTGNIKVIVTAENFNWRWFDAVGEYCGWYGLRLRKVYKKEAYRIELPYHALLKARKTCELMSLENIMKKHLEYYRAYKSDLDDSEFCDVLASLKVRSSSRMTSIGTSSLSIS